MRFWDSSAIVPLLISDQRSSRIESLLKRDEEIAVWWSTSVECASALARAARMQAITASAEEAGLNVLDALGDVWFELNPSEEVRKQARRLLRVHQLRAADALQLAAAIIWSGRYEGREFVTLDDRLREAARAEGFAVLP